MDAGRDGLGILGAIHEGSLYASRVGLFPGLHDYLGKMMATFGIDIPFTVVLNFIDGNIRSGRQDASRDKKGDTMGYLLRMRKDEKIGELDVITTMGATIAAGSDTTAISLSSLFRFLSLNQTCLAQLRKEIDDAGAAGMLSDPVTYQEAQKLPYLQAVIKETLRLHPATGQPMPRVVPPWGAQLAGRYFPAGASRERERETPHLPLFNRHQCTAG